MPCSYQLEASALSLKSLFYSSYSPARRKQCPVDSCRKWYSNVTNHYRLHDGEEGVSRKDFMFDSKNKLRKYPDVYSECCICHRAVKNTNMKFHIFNIHKDVSNTKEIDNIMKLSDTASRLMDDLIQIYKRVCISISECRVQTCSLLKSFDFRHMKKNHI